MFAGGGAGEPLVAVGVRAVFVFELVGDPGGDPFGVGFGVDGMAAQAGGGGDQWFGQGGAVPGPVDEQRAVAVGLDAELVGPVVHDGPVAERAGGQVEPV